MPDKLQIFDLLPVRHPMLLVDRIVELVPGERIETVKAVSRGDPCYAGLADGLPISRLAFPRSLVVESFGQSCALLWLGSEPDPELAAEWVPLAGRVRRCHFHGNAYPGDLIRHRAVLHEVIDGTTAFVSGDVRVADQIIATVGAMTAIRRPRNSSWNGRRGSSRIG